MNNIKNLLTAILLLGGFALQAQNFSWCYSGYNDGDSGGTFPNLENSGIGLRIQGLERASCWGGMSNVYTGINDQLLDGIQHVYTFAYTEPVDIYFSVYQITAEHGTYGHDDFLIFSGNPVFMHPYKVNISGDTVRPLAPDGESGLVWVVYTQVDSFSITHGLGYGYNPGFIGITPIFGGPPTMLLATETLEESRLTSLFPNPNNGRFTLKTGNTEAFQLRIFNAAGQLCLQQNVEGAEQYELQMSESPAGLYFYQLSNTKGFVKGGSFLVQKL